MRRGIIALVVVALVGGCATSGSSSRLSYPDLLEAWVGATEKELIRIWGLPDQVEPLSGGDRAFMDGGKDSGQKLTDRLAKGKNVHSILEVVGPAV